MKKTYTLKAIRALIPMARESFPLIASFDLFGDGTEPWIVRYIVDSHGFWLQVNDNYGVGNTRISHREILGMTGLDTDDLEESNLEGVSRWGFPGGLPILPVPCTAKQLREFDELHGGFFSSAMKRGHFTALPPGVLEVELEKGPPSKDSFAWEPGERDYTQEWLAALVEPNPDAAELADQIISVVAMPIDTTPELGAAIPDTVPVVTVLEPAPAETPGRTAVPLQRGSAQDEAILTHISALGLDPKALPRNKPGKAGVKAAIRSALVGMSPLFPRVGTQFNHAWDRLRARNELADQA